MSSRHYSAGRRSLHIGDAEERVSDSASWHAAAEVASPSQEPQRLHLTQRQHEVLSLLCQGLSNKLIGRRLQISAGTVKTHVGCILRALGVSSRLEAVLIARCWELVKEPELSTPAERAFRRPHHHR